MAQIGTTATSDEETGDSRVTWYLIGYCAMRDAGLDHLVQWSAFYLLM